MKKVLIDTNIYSFALRGDVEVVNALRRIEVIGFSAISIGELFQVLKAVVVKPRTGKSLIFFWILRELLFTPLMRVLLTSTLRY